MCVRACGCGLLVSLLQIFIAILFVLFRFYAVRVIGHSAVDAAHYNKEFNLTELLSQNRTGRYNIRQFYCYYCCCWLHNALK
jgi:hypothetical protein